VEMLIAKESAISCGAYPLAISLMILSSCFVRYQRTELSFSFLAVRKSGYFFHYSFKSSTL